MININKYNDDESPSGETYRVYMKISPQILDKAETASRVKQRIHQVMEWSCAQGLRAGNPVDGVKHLLLKQPSAAVRVQNSPAMTWRMIPEFVEDRIGEPVKVSPTLLLFVSLTAVRSGEGKENRDKHINSGASHNVKINEHFFTKWPMRIERIDDGLIKGEARAFERAILNQLRGHDLWNKKDFEPFRDDNDKRYTDEEVKKYFSSNNEQA